MRLHLLTVALVLSACGSTEPAPAPAPPPPAVAPSEPAAAKPAQAPRRALQVQFTVKNADLASEVLPLFQQQVGIKITWLGQPRQVSLRLTHPMDWEEALALVCQWTKTHPTRDYKGELVLKDGWGGDLGDGDIRALEEGGRGTARTRRGAAGQTGQTQPAWNGGGESTGPSAGQGIPQPTGAYSGGDEATRILRGANTRTSPPR